MLPNCQKVNSYRAGFREIVLGQNPQTFMIPVYSTTVLYDNSVILSGTFTSFVDQYISLGLVPAWSTREGKSYDLGQLAIPLTLENTKITSNTARKSIAWLLNSLEHLTVFQTTLLCPRYMFTWPVAVWRGQRQIEVQNFKQKTPPWVFSLLTFNSPEKLLWCASVSVHLWYEVVFLENRY